MIAAEWRRSACTWMEVWTGGFRVAKPCALCAVIEVFPIAASSMWMCNCNRQNINSLTASDTIA